MIAQMVRCPTCCALAEPKARFCTSCYTVFPSDRNRRVEASTTNKSVTWKGPLLFLVAAAVGAWFVQVDAEDWTAEPGSYQATARDMKRKVLAWADPATGDWHREGRPASHGWFLDNVDSLPCSSGSLCNVVIHFSTGKSASYVVERPNSGGARIIASDARAGDLLRNSTRARLVVAAPRDVAKSISIVRRGGGHWSIVGEDNLTPTNATASENGSMKGVGQ